MYMYSIHPSTGRWWTLFLGLTTKVDLKSINKNYRFICYAMLFILIQYHILFTLLHFLSISFFSFFSYFPYLPYPIHIFSFLLRSYTHPSHRFHLSHSSYPSHPVLFRLKLMRKNSLGYDEDEKITNWMRI